jgi:hypothetical protein
VEDEAGGVCLRVAADDHHLLAQRCEPRHRVLRRSRFADATLAVDCDLSHVPSPFVHQSVDCLGMCGATKKAPHFDNGGAFAYFFRFDEYVSVFGVSRLSFI